MHVELFQRGDQFRLYFFLSSFCFVCTSFLFFIFCFFFFFFFWLNFTPLVAIAAANRLNGVTTFFRQYLCRYMGTRHSFTIRLEKSSYFLPLSNLFRTIKIIFFSHSSAALFLPTSSARLIVQVHTVPFFPSFSRFKKSAKILQYPCNTFAK